MISDVLALGMDMCLLSAWSANSEELIAAVPAPEAPVLMPEPPINPDAGFDALSEARSKGTQTMTSWQVIQHPMGRFKTDLSVLL